jgi:hypothetical protein
MSVATSVACDSSHSADPRVQIIFEYLVCIGLMPNRMVRYVSDKVLDLSNELNSLSREPKLSIGITVSK